MKKFIALLAFASVLASCGVAGLSGFESATEPVSYIDYRPFVDDDFYFIPNRPWTGGFTPIAELKMVLTPATYRLEGLSEGRPPFEELDYEGVLRIVEERRASSVPTPSSISSPRCRRTSPANRPESRLPASASSAIR